MIRILKMSGKYYGKHIDLNSSAEREDIDIFVNEGTPVILIEDISTLDDLDIDPDDVQMVNE